MKNMSNKKIYYGIFAALCIIGLAVGIAGATDLTNAVKGCTGMYGGMYGGMHGFGMGQALSIEDRIAFLESKGIDVTELKAAYEKGDCNAAKAWFIAFREEHMGGRMAGQMSGKMSGNCTPCAGS
jgi:hypothetical protein